MFATTTYVRPGPVIFLPDAEYDALAVSIDTHGVGNIDRWRMASQDQQVPCCIAGHWENTMLPPEQRGMPIGGDNELPSYEWSQARGLEGRPLHWINDRAFDEATFDDPKILWRRLLNAESYFRMMKIHPERERGSGRSVGTLLESYTL